MNFYLFWLALILVLSTEADTRPNARIIGGTDAEPGEFPFAAAIKVITPLTTFFCGGALTRSRWIFTSGHCVYNAVKFTIQLGSTSLNATDPDRLTLESSEFVLHPDFNPDTIENDIGLIKLPERVYIDDNLKNINFFAAPIANDIAVTILGWGQTSDSSVISDKLQYVEVATIDNEECKGIYGSQITDNMICVRGANKGTCNNDNGNPLLWYLGNVSYVVGVSSFISGNGCENGDPSGFTRIAPYYNWINEILLQN